VANIYHDNMGMEEVRTVLEKYYQKGVRFLYIEGGEPYLWRDGHYRLKDIIKLAHDMGYLRIHVYTNGTVSLDEGPEFTWVSVDGLDEAFRKIRGIPLERVLRNLRVFQGKHAIVFVINTINYQEIREFLVYVQRELPGVQVMFYFHTPYYGVDELHLSPDQKASAVVSLIDCKKEGLPVLNSRAALKAYLGGNKGLPVPYWWVVDRRGEYPCCRVNGNPEICKECGYSTCNEILQVRALNPGAILAMLKMF
jgi:MoaA/NifB/PqqE/SkfB family radical SAM enzyme